MVDLLCSWPGRIGPRRTVHRSPAAPAASCSDASSDVLHTIRAWLLVSYWAPHICMHNHGVQCTTNSRDDIPPATLNATVFCRGTTLDEDGSGKLASLKDFQLAVQECAWHLDARLAPPMGTGQSARVQLLCVLRHPTWTSPPLMSLAGGLPFALRLL